MWRVSSVQGCTVRLTYAVAARQAPRRTAAHSRNQTHARGLNSISVFSLRLSLRVSLLLSSVSVAVSVSVSVSIFILYLKLSDLFANEVAAIKKDGGEIWA